MIFVLWIAGLLLAMMIIAYSYKKIEIGKMLVLGTDVYFALYIVAAGVLVARNTFSIMSSLLIVLVFEIMVMIVMTMVKGFYIPKFKFTFKKYIAIIVILIGGFIISSSNRSEVYGAGQDEGLYQIRAWYYMNDVNDNVLDFSEFYNIESAKEQTEYIQYINTMAGYYRLADDDINDEKTSLAKGVTHGILTFPALLGLWCKLFGLSSICGVLTLMFLLAVSNVWLACGNLKLKYYVGIISALTMTVCPILIWSSRNVLTEIVLAMLFSSFFVFITEDKKANKGLLSAIPVFAACYYHVTITIVIPMIVIIYLLMIFSARKAGYAAGLILSMIGYITGFFMMWSSSHAYTYSSFEQIFKMTDDAINGDNVGGYIITAGVIVIVFAAVMLITPLRMGITSGFARMQKKAKGRKIFGIVYAAIATAILVFSVYKCIKVNSQEMRIVNTGIMCYLLNTAFIFVPAAFAGIYACIGRIAKNKNYLAVFTAFLYIVFMYCDFMWVLIYRYFYYARYFTPYVCVVVLAGAILLNKIDFKIVIPVFLISAGILIWQTNILYKSKDLSTYSYDVLDSIVSSISSDDAIIILDLGYGIQVPFALPVKAVTGADIYFAQDYDLMEKIEYYSGYYEDVYILLYDVGLYTDKEGKWRYVYRTSLEASFYDDYIDEGLPYPKETVEFNSPFAVIVYEGEGEEN